MLDKVMKSVLIVSIIITLIVYYGYYKTQSQYMSFKQLGVVFAVAVGGAYYFSDHTVAITDAVLPTEKKSNYSAFLSKLNSSGSSSSYGHPADPSYDDYKTSYTPQAVPKRFSGLESTF